MGTELTSGAGARSANADKTRKCVSMQNTPGWKGATWSGPTTSLGSAKRAVTCASTKPPDCKGSQSSPTVESARRMWRSVCARSLDRCDKKDFDGSEPAVIHQPPMHPWAPWSPPGRPGALGQPPAPFRVLIYYSTQLCQTENV